MPETISVNDVIVNGEPTIAPDTDGGGAGTAYTTGDPASATINDTDYVPLSDANGNRKKSLWSNIKEKLKSFFLPLFKTTTLDVDNIAEDGLWEVHGAITGAPTTNHGLLLNMSSVGTPLQMFFPDASLYSYKRNYTNGAWTSWSLLKAGLADSATNAGNAEKAKTISEIAMVGSDAENSNGWYKVCSGTLTGYNNVSLIFAVHNASSGNSGLLVVDLRCDNGSSLAINKFGWLVRNDYALTDFIINTNGNNWTIYQNITRVRYWRDFWVLLEQSGTNTTPIHNSYTLHSNVAKESTTPTATATSADIGIVAYATTSANTTTAAKLGRGGNINYPMTFNWSGQSGQPAWLWGGDDGTNMYVYNPSNFIVKRTKELNYATDTTDKNSDNGNGWYSVGEAANANYDSHKPLAINWYWGIDIRTRGIAYTKINGYEILTKEKSSSYITIKSITGTITKANGSNASITAPTLSGYTFKCWLSVASDGWVGNLYIQSLDNSATRIWSANYGYNDTSTGKFIAYALYIISN